MVTWAARFVKGALLLVLVNALASMAAAEPPVALPGGALAPQARRAPDEGAAVAAPRDLDPSPPAVKPPASATPGESGLLRAPMPEVARRHPERHTRHLGRRPSTPSLPLVDVEMWVTADLGGELGPLRCDARDGAFRLARLVEAIEEERRQAEEDGREPPLVVSAGDLLGDGPLTRFLLQAGQQGAGRMAGLLTRLDFDLLVPGPSERSGDAAALQLLHRAAGKELPYAACNLTCRTPKDARCHAVALAHAPPPHDFPGYRLKTRNGVRIAIVPVVWPPAGSGTQGVWTATPAVSALNAAAHAAREDGRADVVVAIAHLGERAEHLLRASQLARLARGVDAVIVNAIAPDRAGGGVQSLRFNGSDRPPIFAVAGERDGWLRVTLRMVRRGGRFYLVAADASTQPADTPDATVQQEMRVIQDLYCAAYGASLGESRFASSMDAEDFAQYVIEIMRFSTESDVAVIPRRHVDLDALATFSGPITRDFVYRAVPSNELLVRLDVPGQALRDWLERVHQGAVRYDFAGVRQSGATRKDDGQWEINGRSLDAERSYMVTAPASYVGDGADGLPTAEAEPWNAEDALPLRELVERWFSERRYAEQGATAVELATNFPNLADELLWSYRQDVTGAFNLTRIENPAGYTDRPQLDRDEFFGLEGNALLRVEGKSRQHDWSAFLTIAYATNQVAGQTAFNESKDRVQFESAYSWLALRQAAGDAIAIPVPEVRLRLTSELTQSEELPYHHLEMTGIFGVKWLLGEKLSTGLGYSVGGELLDPGGRPRQGMSAYFEALKAPLFDLFGSPLHWESRLDMFYTDIARDNAFEAILTAKLSTTLAGPLSLTVAFTGYGFASRGQALGVSADTTIGLQLTTSWWHQTF